MQGLRIAVAPQLSRLLGAGRVDEAMAVYRQTTVWAIVLGWPVYLLLAVFGPGFLALFGSGFTAGAPAMTVLAVAMLVNVGLGNVQTLLLMSGNTRRHLLATALGLATTVLGGVTLIPGYGALGAAIAWGGGIVVENVVAAHAARAALGRAVVSASLVRAAIVVMFGTAPVCLLAVLVAGRGLAGIVLAVTVLAAGCVTLLDNPSVQAGVRDALRMVRGG
jgi:O-antigen/teichoic acid export membrane protein